MRKDVVEAVAAPPKPSPVFPPKPSGVVKVGKAVEPEAQEDPPEVFPPKLNPPVGFPKPPKTDRKVFGNEGVLPKALVVCVGGTEVAKTKVRVRRGEGAYVE